MATNKLNHELIIKTIIDNGGEILGGYVRAWVENGEPSDNGWSDIDCKFNSIENFKNAKKIIFNEHPVNIDLKVTHFGEFFNDFWCNCWKFDGQLKMIKPALGNISFQELENETKAKIAKCIISFFWVMRLPHRVLNLINRGWTICESNGDPVPPKTIQRIISIYKPIQSTVSGSMDTVTAPIKPRSSA
jgi:hypothetical protein